MSYKKRHMAFSISIKIMAYFTVICFLFSHVPCRLQHSRATRVVLFSSFTRKVIRGGETTGMSIALAIFKLPSVRPRLIHSMKWAAR